MPLCLVILDERLEFLGTVEELYRGEGVRMVNDVGIATNAARGESVLSTQTSVRNESSRTCNSRMEGS